MPPADLKHPAPGTLRSYLDGELGWLSVWRCALHVRRCRTCRAALAQEERTGRLSRALLARLELPLDTEESSSRLRVLSGATTGRPSHLHPRTILWIGSGGVAVALLLFLWVGRDRHAIPGGSAIGMDGGARIQDACCWNLDGGGPGDDGVVAVTLPGERVVALALYEDGNGSGSLSTQDPIRYGSLEAVPATRSQGRTEESESRSRDEDIVTDVCCADYDGGGRLDDGVLTWSRPGELVERVMLYEDDDGSRSFSEGDRLRWSTDVSTARKGTR